MRTQLDHPVIDGDGHWLEPMPIFLDYLREVAGPVGRPEFMKKATATSTWLVRHGPAERLDRRLIGPTWWGEPATRSTGPPR